MQNLKTAVLAAVLGCAIPGVSSGAAQAGNSTEEDRAKPEIVTGQAFSAVRYARIVRVQPGGKRAIVREGHRVLMARDREGRVYMAGAGMADKQCDLPSLGKLPLCDYWEPFLFDPKARTMWHWSDGEVADATQLVQMGLRDDQFAEALQRTSALDPPAADAAEPNTTVQRLSERSFEGIPAVGVRTTTTHAGRDGKPVATIHEVWTSTRMRLVLRVVDGDPEGEETVSGLTRISLTPDAKLFHPPEGRILRHWEAKDDHGLAAPDIEYLSEWLIN